MARRFLVGGLVVIVIIETGFTLGMTYQHARESAIVRTFSYACGFVGGENLVLKTLDIPMSVKETPACDHERTNAREHGFSPGHVMEL